MVSRWSVCVWVWAELSCLMRTHSIFEDPHLNFGHHAVLTSLQQQANGQQEAGNHLALEVLGGEAAARTLAQKYGLHYVCQVFRDPPVYHLHNPPNSSHHHHDYLRHHRRMPRSIPDVVQLLANEPGVKWVNQQTAFFRDKRHKVAVSQTSSLGQPATGKLQQQARKRMERWQEEEELGLSDKTFRSLLIKSEKNMLLRSIDMKRDFQPSSTSLPSAKFIATGRVDSRQLNREATGTLSPEEQASFSSDVPVFNDPLFKDEWYLHNTGQLGRQGCDLNVTGAWRQGFTGQGVTLSILDDGFQTTNADLAANYNPEVSYSLVRDGQPENDPSPRLDPPEYSNSHGTYCAGVAAAVANNGVCGVGVAYEASVGGVRIVDGSVTDVQEAIALSRHVDEVAVFSASWGPKDDGQHVEGPGRLAKMALLHGVTKGRGGLGTVYVWASGNGGLMDDNCNLDGYASSIYTLTVSALTDLGGSTFYAEPCASTLAGVYVGGTHTLEEALDPDVTKMRVVVPELDGHCSHKFQGSSAAAPLMAGVVALTLQANPGLSWRDVQHLAVATATPTTSALQEDGWHINAMGKKFHLMQGFGAIDAGKMVEAARNWQNVGPQRTEDLALLEGYRNISSYGWVNVSQELSAESPISAVEHVVAAITLRHHQRSLIRIYIVSPSGTESQVLTHRSQDSRTTGFHGWGFMSVHLWGENPAGVWTVAIKSDSEQTGRLIKIDLTIYGT